MGYVKKKGLGLLWGNVKKLDGTVIFLLDGTVAKTNQVPSGQNCNLFGYGFVAGTYALNQTLV